MIKKKEITIIEKYYFEDLKKIKETLKQSQNKAMIIVNNVMVMAYYEIGTIINQRKTWGNKYLQRLAIDLKCHSGMSLANLKRMSLIAKSFSYKEISSQPVSQIPWATLLTLIHKTSTHDELLWYANYTFINNFSRTDIEKERMNG